MRRFTLLVSLVCCLSLLLGACAEERLGEALQTREFQFPAGLAIHPAGYAFVASTNIDLAHVHGALRVIDLNALAAALDNPDGQGDDPYYSQTIMADQGIGIDNFSGSVALSEDGTLLAVAVRETGQLVLIDVAVTMEGGPSSLELDCWEAGLRPNKAFPYCKGSRHIFDVGGDDPYDVILVPGDLTDEGQYQTAWVTFLRSGDVMGIEVPPKQDTGDSPEQLTLVSTTVEGASDLAQAPGTGLVYVTSRFPSLQTNPVHYFDPAEGISPTVYRVNFFEDFLGNETRSIAFASDGVTAGLLVRNPDMLVFLDTSLGYDGNPLNSFLGVVAVGSNPSRVRSLGDTMLVTGAQDDTIHVIDAKAKRLLDVREDICTGPFDIDFWDGGVRQWALISCFEDETIAVMDVDSASPTYLQVLARVGKPRKGS